MGCCLESRPAWPCSGAFPPPTASALTSARIDRYHRGARSVVVILDRTLGWVGRAFDPPAGIAIGNLAVSISVERVASIWHSDCRRIASSRRDRKTLLSDPDTVAPPVRVAAPDAHRRAADRNPGNIGLDSRRAGPFHSDGREDKIQCAIDRPTQALDGRSTSRGA